MPALSGCCVGNRHFCAQKHLVCFCAYECIISTKTPSVKGFFAEFACIFQRFFIYFTQMLTGDRSVRARLQTTAPEGRPLPARRPSPRWPSSHGCLSPVLADEPPERGGPSGPPPSFSGKTEGPEPWKRWGRSSTSPGSGSVRSRPRRCGNCGIPAEAKN